MLNSAIGLLRLERNGLPGLLQGAEPESIFAPEDMKGAVAPNTPRELCAVWNIAPSGYRTILPNLIIGIEAALQDALAWSSSFLTGVGPITGLVRVLSTSEFSDFVVFKPERYPRSINDLSQAVSLIIGEICARQGTAAEVEKLTVANASNTLAFAVLRAATVSPYFDPDEVARRWRTVHAADLRGAQDRVTDVVIELCQDIMSTTSFGSNHRPHGMLQFQGLDQPEIGFAPHQMSRELMRALPHSLLHRANEMGAEEVVRVADVVFPALLRMPKVSPGERAEVAASIATRANPDLGNQLELVRDLINELPELGVFLGRNYSKNAPGRILSVNDGAGWRIAGRLAADFDFFSFPTADLSWTEFKVLDSLADTRRKAIRGRRTVELLPGVTTTTFAAAETSAVEVDSGGKVRRQRSRNQLHEQEMLDVAQRNLEDAMRAIKVLKNRR